VKRLLLLVTALGALAACTRTSGTVEIPPQELPFPVARAATSPETPAPRRSFTVYFVRNERLVGVPRDTDVDAPPSEGSLRALLDGPSPSDRRAGIASELPPDVRLLGVTRGGTTLLVDLSGEFQAPAPPLGIALRVAQVVWTLTELPGVSEVLFAIDGETVEIATGDGTVVGRAVNRSDYASFSPP
jgi:spore germination protein GerM